MKKEEINEIQRQNLKSRIETMDALYSRFKEKLIVLDAYVPFILLRLYETSLFAQ